MPRRAWAQLAFGASMVAAVFALTGGVGAADGAALPLRQPSDDAQVQRGRDLFVTGCATCHGVDAKGRTLQNGVRAPSLYGVGEASADFQLRTGRMPLASPNAQAVRKPTAYP
ncbi:MAG: c-type cytochrome, partial [Candidatus Microthrix subdominans]